MAGLYWMAVTLALMLSAGNSLPALSQIKLLEIVNQIRNRFAPKDWNDDWAAPGYSKKNQTPLMYSVAVSIPYDKKKIYDISKVTDNATDVKSRILKCEVYTSKRMVAATVLKWSSALNQCPKGRVQWPDVLNECRKKVRWKVNTWEEVDESCPGVVDPQRADHAEYRILQKFKTLLDRNDKKQNFLLFYVRSSPCPRRCTNESSPENILKSINKIKKWGDYAVVFSDVFKPHGGGIPDYDDLRESLERLGTFQGDLGPIGLDHIFRCNKQECKSCSDNNKVAWYCFSDNKSSGRSRKPQQGRSGQGARGKQSKNIGGQGGSGPDVGKGSRQKKGKQGKNIGGQGGSGPDVGKGSRQKKGKQGKNIGGQGGSGPDVGKGSRQKKGKQGKNIGGQGGSGPDVGKGSRQKKGKQGKNIGGQGGSGPDVGKGSRQKKGKQGKNIGGQGGSGPDVGKGSRQKKGKSKG